MRVMFVITGLTVGGAERVVVNLADYLARLNHEVIIVYLKGNPILLPQDSSVQIFSLDLNGIRNLPHAFLRLCSHIKKFKPHVINSHLVHANILTRIVRVFLKISYLISSAHNVNEEGRWRMLAYQYTDRLADITTNVSNEAVAKFVSSNSVPSSKIARLYNGIPTNIFFFNSASASRVRDEFSIDKSTKIIMTAGRLTEQKDFPNLLLALHSLPVTTPPYVVLIVGDGPLKNTLCNMRDELSLADRVHFLGIRMDMVDLLSAADIFVLSSAWEGFPMIVGEAMACECAIVATDCGGVREFLGETGFLVPPNDSTELSRALTLALQLSEDDLFRIGKNARHRVESTYSLDVMVDNWLALARLPNRH